MRRRLLRLYSFKTVLIPVTFAAAGAFMSGCGRGFDKGYASFISAPNSTVRVSQSLQLSTQTKTTGSPMSFWVNGVLGGDAKVGTIDNNGLYTAPESFPSRTQLSRRHGSRCLLGLQSARVRFSFGRQ
jgi:hypothetical protein